MDEMLKWKRALVTLLISLVAFPLMGCEHITVPSSEASSNQRSSEPTSSVPTRSSESSSEPSIPNPSSSQTDPATYHVRFVNDDDSLLYETDVEEGGNAVYVGETPAKEEDDEFTYTFSGWDPEPTNVRQNLVCKAQYDAEPKENWGSIIWF